MAPPHRVVVTGVGQVSALGTDLASFSRSLFAGEAGVARLDLDVPGLAEPIPSARGAAGRQAAA